MDRRLETAQRITLVTVTVLVGVAVWRPLADPFMLAKLTAIVLGVAVLLTLAAVRAVRNARLTVPSGPAVLLATGLAVALVLATLTADSPLLALVGRQRRYSGLLSYLSYFVVFLFTLRLFATTGVAVLSRAVVAASGVVSAYGLVQVAGLDPYSWSARLDETIFSTLGNTNFAAAYVAMTLPVVAAVALSSASPRAWRIAAAVLLAVGGLYVLATKSSQGPIAAAAGVAVVGVAWLRWRRRGPARSSPVRRAWVLAGAAVAVLALGLLARRLAPDVVDSSLGERLQFWQAALGIFADHPALGAGLDSFRDYFLRYRPVEHAVERGYQAADSAHNVPLGMFASGGLVLGLSYLAFVGFTAWALLRGLRTVAADRLLPLAGFGGMWAAYQVQSLVSLDVPAVAFHHFLAAGVIHALVRAPSGVSLRLPLASAARGNLLPKGPPGRRRLAAAVMAGVVLLGLVSAWVGSRPVRADLAASEGRAERDLAAYERAVDLAPWEAEYRLFYAQALMDAGRKQEAYAEAVAASDLRLGSSKLALGNADLALRDGDRELARNWVDVALRRDPRNPKAFEDAAEIAERADEPAWAAELTARAQALRAEGGEG